MTKAFKSNTSEKLSLQQLLSSKTSNPHANFKTDANFLIDNPMILYDMPYHVSWVYENIYRHSYLNSERNTLPRENHDIRHVTQVALFIQVFANLYRKYNHAAALALTKEELVLLQIAGLFHDSGREGAGVDRWDKHSALLLYGYLTNVLQLEQDKAIPIAEAVANKDITQSSTHVFRIIRSEGDYVYYENVPLISSQFYEKNIYQNLIHDADCLEVIRRRNCFDVKHLDFYEGLYMNKLTLSSGDWKFIVSDNHDSDYSDSDSEQPALMCSTNAVYLTTGELLSKLEFSEAFLDLMQLVKEARSLIAIQGNDYAESLVRVRRGAQFDIKKKYYENTLSRIYNDIFSTKFPLLDKFVRDLYLDALKLSTVKSPIEGELGHLQMAYQEGRMFIRGVRNPGMVALKQDSLPNITTFTETNAQIECRKTFRVKGVPTRNQNLNKNGNERRSISNVWYGACSIYARAGFIIIDPEIQSILCVSDQSLHSKMGKKKTEEMEAFIRNRPDDETIQSQLDVLRRKLKINSDTRTPSEILCCITRYDAIFFTCDPHTIENRTLLAGHELFGLLDALVLRNTYAAQYIETKKAFISTFGTDSVEQFEQRFGKTPILPVINYSGIHSTLNLVPDEWLSNEYIAHRFYDLYIQYFFDAKGNPLPFFNEYPLPYESICFFEQVAGARNMDDQHPLVIKNLLKHVFGKIMHTTSKQIDVLFALYINDDIYRHFEANIKAFYKPKTPQVKVKKTPEEISIIAPSPVVASLQSKNFFFWATSEDTEVLEAGINPSIINLERRSDHVIPSEERRSFVE